MSSKTTYEQLEEVAKIEDEQERAVRFRELLLRNNVAAIVVQRTYHPNYNFNLPKGDLPDFIKPSNHDESGPFLSSIRKWDKFRVVEEFPQNTNLKKHVVEQAFFDLYESVSTGDSKLLLAVKDKELPWTSLSKDFVVSTIPEMFPSNTSEEKPEQKAIKTVHSPEKSKREICQEIMESNPGLSRKDYLNLFEAQGVAKITGGQYYQGLKDVINA